MKEGVLREKRWLIKFWIYLPIKNKMDQLNVIETVWESLSAGTLTMTLPK